MFELLNNINDMWYTDTLLEMTQRFWLVLYLDGLETFFFEIR